MEERIPRSVVDLYSKNTVPPWQQTKPSSLMSARSIRNHALSWLARRESRHYVNTGGGIENIDLDSSSCYHGCLGNAMQKPPSSPHSPQLVFNIITRIDRALVPSSCLPIDACWLTILITSAYIYWSMEARSGLHFGGKLHFIAILIANAFQEIECNLDSMDTHWSNTPYLCVCLFMPAWIHSCR